MEVKKHRVTVTPKEYKDELGKIGKAIKLIDKKLKELYEVEKKFFDNNIPTEKNNSFIEMQNAKIKLLDAKNKLQSIYFPDNELFGFIKQFNNDLLKEAICNRFGKM